MSIDNSLLKHYGKCFDNIYYHYDYVQKCFRWSHDLVTLYYSDDQTDYPIDYQLWLPPDWEAVDDDLLSGIQQRLQTETDCTLPFLHRLLKAEDVLNIVEYVLEKINQGHALREVFKPLAQRIAYTQ